MLEFLGDAVLDMVISHLLMKKYPEATEGELSKSRSSLVNTKRLSILARQFDLGKYILLGKGEDQSQGRSKPTILTCAYEAIIGAIYLDGGFNKVAKVIHSHFAQLISHKLSKVIYRDFKSRLQEYVQGTLKTIPEYQVLSESGPPHAKEFEIHIKINGKSYGSGRGKSKKQAQQRAAMATLKQLGLSANPPSAERPSQ
jgi:ribonuclease-3